MIKFHVMRIHEIMTASPVTVRETTSIGQAWDVLRSLEIRHLPVVNADRELVGIVSDRDFAPSPDKSALAELLGEGPLRLDAPVSTIMTSAPLSMEADAEVAEAVDLMLENKVGAIPVVAPDGHVVGIVSFLDVLRATRNTVELGATT